MFDIPILFVIFNEKKQHSKVSNVSKNKAFPALNDNANILLTSSIRAWNTIVFNFILIHLVLTIRLKSTLVIHEEQLS